MGDKEKCIQNFGWEAEGKRPLGRPKYIWKVNVDMDRKNIR
jgi:hypothetical protein